MYDYLEDDGYSEKQTGQAYDLLNHFELRSNGDLFTIRQDANDNVIAACFVGFYGGVVEFDIVVAEDHQNKKIAFEFVEQIIQEYKEVATMFYACCVNPIMAHILNKYFGFICDQKVCDTQQMILENSPCY